MDKSDLKNLRMKLGLSQAKFAHAIGYSKRTIEAWERSDQPLAPRAEFIIQEVFGKQIKQ